MFHIVPTSCWKRAVFIKQCYQIKLFQLISNLIDKRANSHCDLDWNTKTLNLNEQFDKSRNSFGIFVIFLIFREVFFFLAFQLSTTTCYAS